MHTVAVLALDGVIPFDLAMPLEVFGRARLPSGGPAYRLRVCAAQRDVDAGAFTLRAPWTLADIADADTVLVPGVADLSRPVPVAAVDALVAAARNGSRVASVCVGAFTLAAAGLLDGLRATTHWAAAAELARRYPLVDVDPNVLYVDNGPVLTSAGAAAGLDLCLHMIRTDHGSAVAADAARLSVMPLERAGGQAQFIIYEPPAPDGASLQPVLSWLENNLSRTLTVEDIAAQASLSTRTLNRRFRDQTDTTPLQWLHRSRLRQAQYLLETTDHPVDRIYRQVGFTSPTAFRERFKQLVGTSPRAYRSSFRQ